MKVIGAIVWGVVGTCILSVAGPSFGQVVINEIVKEQINPLTGAGINPDTREFIELYNAGPAAQDISGWTLNYFRVSGAAGIVNTYTNFFDTISPGTVLDPGEFYVLGSTGIENLNQPLDGGTPTDLFEDAVGTVIELRSGTVASSAPIVDAVAYDTGRTGQANPNITGDRLAQTGHGFHGRPIWADLNRISWGRWQDGVDTNDNGRDFGILEDSPGTMNDMPLVSAHVVPDVDALTSGSAVPGYYSPFVPPRAIDPTQVGPMGNGANINPRAIPAPPEHTNATKAVIVWDETGGGNVVHARELNNRFDIYAYFDTTPIGATGATGPSTETTAYGIGTADPFFGTPDPEGIIFPTATTYVQNSSTGIGWLYQQRDNTDGTPVYSNLYLVDFGAGGDSRPAAGVWDIKQEIDMSSKPSGWYHLSVDYDPATDEVVATFDDQTFTFTTDAELVGGFYVGYRTGISNFSGNIAQHNPATFIQFVPPAGLTGDYNDDGKVDAADYVVWRKTNINGAQGYTDWRANFGAMAGAGGGASAVPEPAAAALLVIGLALVGWRRAR